MRERRAQIVLLVRAFEEADRDGRLLGAYARNAATRRSLAVTGLLDYPGELGTAPNILNGEAVMRRARVLFGALERRLPVLRGVLKVGQLGASSGPSIVGAALVLGLATSLIGPPHAVDVLSAPLLLLLAWNVVSCAAMIAAIVVRGPRAGASPRGVSAWLAEMLLKGALWRRIHGRRIARCSEAEGRIAVKGLVRFGALWHRAAAPLLAARARRMLHVGAVAAVAGVLAGMCLEGLALGRPAAWRTAWIGAPQAQALLDVVLGPAAALIGDRVPDLGNLRWPHGAGDAVPWIRLYAATAALFVGLPRVALVALEAWRNARLASAVAVDLGDAYFSRMFTAWRGATQRVRILPYGARPGPGSTDALLALLRDLFGARADIGLFDPVVPGTSPETVLTAAACGGAEEREVSCVVLFDAAQSPEPGVHGAFLENLKLCAQARQGRLLILIDVSSGRRRAVPEARAPIEDWRRMVREAGLTAVEVDLDRPAGDEVLEELVAGLWPPAPRARVA